MTILYQAVDLLRATTKTAGTGCVDGDMGSAGSCEVLALGTGGASAALSSTSI